MKKIFRLKDYQGNYVMHCNTEEKAKIFCNYLYDNNKQWCDGGSYLDTTEWNIFQEDTCYDFNDGSCQKENGFENINYIIPDINYTILEFDDFGWGNT